LEAADGSRGERGDVAFKNLGAGGRLLALDREHVLDAYGQAGQGGERFAGGGERVDTGGLGESAFAIDRQVGVDGWVAELDLVKTGGGEVAGRGRAAGDGGAHVVDREHVLRGVGFAGLDGHRAGGFLLRLVRVLKLSARSLSGP
jgi:hypothetical protein